MKYNPVEIVNISLDFGKVRKKVGRLALLKRRIFFEYNAEFLDSSLQISPFKLPLKSGAVTCDDMVFEGLFGVFNDYLPDGWGKLLLDRQVRKYGIPAESLTPLDRLAHIGKLGMGALIFEPDYMVAETSEKIQLHKLSCETAKILAGEYKGKLEKLLSLAGSSAGARPKIMVGVSKDKKRIIHNQQKLPKDYEYWMIKFASGSDVKDIGALEYSYSLMAQLAGLEMMPTHLFEDKYFATQRFDRSNNHRLHFHTISGLLHSDHRIPSLDYEQIMRATQAITRNMQEVEKIFRIAVFNVFAHNRDDHGKNFSFLMNAQGQWRVAPAYDLTFSSGPAGEHSTTIMGEGKNPTNEHLLKLAEKFGIKKNIAQEIIEKTRYAISKWRELAEEAGVSKSTIKSVEKILAIDNPMR